MLSIRDLRVSFGGAEILHGVDLDLRPGESLSIVGESGAGKTTLALALMALSSGRVSGKVLLAGRDLLSLPEEQLREIRGREIAMVFQDVEAALDPVYTVQDQIAEALSVHQRLGRMSIERRVREILSIVGLDEEKAASYPHQLSGGERQRALIAMALINDPQVLILDEPTASLDAATKAGIMGVLRSVIQDRISLLITHDLSLAAGLTGRMAVLYSGRILEQGRTDELLGDPRHPYTRGLVRSYPGMNTTKDLQGIPGRMEHGILGCPFHPRCTQAIDLCRSTVPLLIERECRLIACHRGGVVPLLELRGLHSSFGRRPVLDGIDLTLYEGETLALVGQSGSGKTTLARVVMGLLEPGSGMIFLEGSRVEGRGPSFYRSVQMVFQNPRESVSHRLTVRETVLEPLEVLGIGDRRDRLSRVKEVLRSVELPSDEAFLGRYPHQLSGGEVQRLAIARALSVRPKLLIADEPTSALDPSVQAKILRLLLDLQEDLGLGMLFITHDLALARKVSDRMAVILDGRIVEQGPTSRVLSSPGHPYTRALLLQACSGGAFELSGLPMREAAVLDIAV